MSYTVLPVKIPDMPLASAFGAEVFASFSRDWVDRSKTFKISYSDISTGISADIYVPLRGRLSSDFQNFSVDRLTARILECVERGYFAQASAA